MRSSVVLLLSIVLVNATIVHDSFSLSARHARISRRESTLEVYVRAVAVKRCPNLKNKAAAAALARSSSTSVAKPSSSLKNNSPSPAVPQGNAPTPAPAPAPTPVNHNSGLIQVTGNCGPNGANLQVTSVSGPNGHIDWMNCGFESAGWNPPYVTVHDIVTTPLGTALQDPNSPFKACGPYTYLFETYGGMYGIPAILLASFAMQESSCRPWMVGGAGEQGLMQITVDKCGGAPNGDCKDPDFNIRTGAKYFADTLASVGGNVFLAVGTYNGWRPGLTRWAAFAAAQSACCRCQNNGDYLMQFFNGWCQNIDPSSRHLGKYFNLAVCG